MTLYVILIRRDIDQEAWPCVYRDRALAEHAYGRVSVVRQVELEELVAVKADDCDAHASAR